MARIVIPRPRRSTQRFYRPGPKLDPSMKGKFGAAELQFLTKAIDTAIAVGGKVIGAVERSQMDKGATSDAVAAAARSEGGMGGQKAMDAVSRVQAAADELGAGALAPGPAAFAADQEASSAPTPVATEEAVAVQEVGRPIVAMGPAPERAAAIARMEEARADMAAEPELVPAGLHGKAYTGLTPQERLPGPTQAHQMGALADALGRAQALVHHADNTGDLRHLDQARLVFEQVFEGEHGQVTAEQLSALVESPITKAAFSRVLLRDVAGGVTSLSDIYEREQAAPTMAPIAAGPAPAPPAPSLTTTAPAPMAQAVPAPVAQQVAPQQQVAMSAEEALFRQRRQLDERERQRAAAFLPQNLRRMRPGQLRAVLRFAKTPQEAAAVMGAIRRAPEVQPMGLGDILTGRHVQEAQKVPGWKPPSVKAPPSEFEQTMDLQRHNAWLKWKESQATANQALTDQRNAAIKAAQDKVDRDALRRSSRVSGSSGGDRAVFGNLMAHRKYYQAYQEGAGRFSAPSVADRLSRAYGESRQYSEADISAARDADWRGMTGVLSDATPADREDRARGLFSSRRGGKKYSSIVKDIKASDKKVIDQALKTEKEARIAQNQAARIEQARQRLRMRLESAAKNLSAAQRDLAKANAARRVGTRDQEAYYDAWAQELVEMMGQGAAPEQAPPPATPVAPVPAGDDALIEQMKAKYGQAE